MNLVQGCLGGLNAWHVFVLAWIVLINACCVNMCAPFELVSLYGLFCMLDFLY